MSDSYFIEDANELRYAAYNPPEDYIFGSVVYNKAGWVLHMLREQLLGDELFYEVMHEWVSRYANGTVNTEDFINLVNELSGQDYRWFFDQWIYGMGHPELSIDISVSSMIDDVSIHAIQHQENAPIFRYPLVVDITTSEATISEYFWFDQQDQIVTRHFPGVQSASLVEHQPLLYEDVTESVDREHPLNPASFEFPLNSPRGVASKHPSTT
jgi:aminopeptidase N